MSCMCKRAFIEVTGDDSDVVIFSLDQTQFIVQHANKRPYIKNVGGKKRSLTQSLFFY